MALVCLERGKPFSIADVTGLEGFFFNITPDGFGELIVAFPNMTEEELDAITNGLGRVGLFTYDGVIYVTCKFKNIEGDSAYHALYGEDKVEIGDAPDGVGMTLCIYAVDSKTNTFLAGRVCGMGTQWTRRLKQLVEEQKKETNFSKDGYLQKVKEAHRRWTPKQMFKLSQTYRLGTKEENQLRIIK